MFGCIKGNTIVDIKKKSIFDMHTQNFLKKYKKKQKTNKKGYKLDEFVEEWLGRD